MGSLMPKQMKESLLDMLLERPKESTISTNIVMESIHITFDDKKIEGLKDEGFHENLRFENADTNLDEYEEGEADATRMESSNQVLNDSQRIIEVEGHLESSVERHSTASVEDHHGPFVERNSNSTDERSSQ